MRALAEGTGIPTERVWETSLLSDEGYIFLYRQYGTTEWVLPTVNVDGHVSKGLAYCPLCLQSDVDPYYRKSWRYAFNPVCPTHRVFLRQGCPECGNPHYYFGVSGHKIGGSPIQTCMHCSADIGKVPINTHGAALIDRALQIQEQLHRGIATDSFDVPGYGYVRALLQPHNDQSQQLICQLSEVIGSGNPTHLLNATFDLNKIYCKKAHRSHNPLIGRVCHCPQIYLYITI